VIEPMNFSRRRRPPGCLSDLTLDKLVAGAPATRATVEEHLATCMLCTQRLDELRRLNVRAALVLADGPGKLRRRLWRRTFVRASQALAAAAMLAFIVLLPIWRQPGHEREKGQGLPLELALVARQADGRIVELASGGRVHAGDAVRFLLSTGRGGHVVVLGLDAAGKVSVYVADGERGLHVERGARQAMPGSIILDATPGAERVVALLCPERFAVSDAVDAAQARLNQAEHDPHRTGELRLPGCAEVAWIMEKTSGP
jgi:hypothetical protein